ncbi:MAG TPA: hypothetical protein VN915_06975, partial [Elusimicrobiota bacterium]|nr:hypothetical protein [Elusimicrobiota bacterium]
MTSIRCTRTLKSGIAVAVSFALFFTSAGWPASQAFAQVFNGAARAGEAGTAPVALPAASLSNSSPVRALSLGAAPLSPALSAAPSAFAPRAVAASPVAAAAPAIANAAAALTLSPAASVPESPKPAPSATAPAETPAPSATPDSGPRWVGEGGAPAQPGTPDNGPRWVGSGVKAWLGQQLSRLSGAGAAASRKEFDGGVNRGELSAGVPVNGAESSAAAPLAKPGDEAARVINDVTIPTPEAARRVGALRHEHGTPLWAKIVAPVSVLAAGVVAFHFGAVGVLTLGAGLVLSVLAHEVAHIAVLQALGDKTAEHAGSHSLNPFHHIDAVKTVIAPALSLALSTAVLGFPVLIGSGKAVDADFNNLRGPLGGPR